MLLQLTEMKEFINYQQDGIGSLPLTDEWSPNEAFETLETAAELDSHTNTKNPADQMNVIEEIDRALNFETVNVQKKTNNSSFNESLVFESFNNLKK